MEMTISNNSYYDFFEDYEKFKKEQGQQKRRGLNDYNILTTVLKAHDEVRLHSRMIESLLNIHAKHYQGSLFLDLFLKAIGFHEFFSLQDESIITRKEHQDIDIYITDNSRHIIIENKINAKDQKKQIKRYIENIKKSHPETTPDDVLVIYLSCYSKDPTEYSLGTFKISQEKILDEKENAIAIYKNITYEKEILTWLIDCQKEVQNITNLNQALKQYIQVVKQITQQFKGDIMNLKDFFLSDINKYKNANEVSMQLPEIKKENCIYFLKNTRNFLNEKLDDSWEVELTNHDLSKKGEYPLRIYKKEWKEKKHLVFGFEFRQNNYKSAEFGLIRSKNSNINIKDIRDKLKIKVENNTLFKNQKWEHGDNWIFLQKLTEKHDFIEYIFSTSKNGDVNCDEFANKILGYIKIVEKENHFVSDVVKHLNSAP